MRRASLADGWRNEPRETGASLILARRRRKPLESRSIYFGGKLKFSKPKIRGNDYNCPFPTVGCNIFSIYVVTWTFISVSAIQKEEY